MEIIFGIFVVVAVIAVAGALFTLWLAVTVVKAVCRAIFPKKKKKSKRITGPQACTNGDCRGDNPEHARFCRRCGRPLPSLLRLVESRAA